MFNMGPNSKDVPTIQPEESHTSRTTAVAAFIIVALSATMTVKLFDAALGDFPTELVQAELIPSSVGPNNAAAANPFGTTNTRSTQPTVAASTAAGTGQTRVATKSRALRMVLDDIGRQNGVTFHVDSEIADRQIAIDPHKVSFEQALPRLLVGFDSFHYFEAQSLQPAKLRAVWIYPQGQGLALAPGTSRAYAGQKRGTSQVRYANQSQLERPLLEMVADVDPAVRMHVVSALANGINTWADKGAASGALNVAMSDVDPLIRGLAIQALASYGGDGTLMYQIQGLQDADPMVRVMAIDAIDPHSQGASLLQAALTDPDETVRLAAKRQLATESPTN